MSTLCYSGPSSAYKELVELPIVDAVQFLQSDGTTTVVRANYTVRDHDHKTKHPVTKTYTLSMPDSAPFSQPIPLISAHATLQDPDVRGRAASRSGKLQAILKERADGKMQTTRTVQIWSDLRLVASLDVSKVHGSFLADAQFQSISFSPSETAIVYSAEVSEETPDGDPFVQHAFKPHFGESYRNIRRPTLVMVHWRDPANASSDDKTPVKTTSVTLISLPPPLSEDIVLGQAIFADEDRIFATGFKKSEDGQFLGIKWCLNRPSSIWELTIVTDIQDGSPAAGAVRTAVEIQAPGRSCRSPRIFFDRNGTPKWLLWLSNPVGGVHSSATSLHIRDLVGDSEDKILVDSVSDPETGDFPGLYALPNLPPEPFVYTPEPSIVLHTLWGSCLAIVFVNIETGAITHGRSLFGTTIADWTVLATDGFSKIVCSHSSLAIPPRLVLIHNCEGSWVRTLLDSTIVSPQVKAALDDLTLSVIPIPGRYPAETIVVQSLKAMAADGPKPYCITIPHGGPHAASTMGFAPWVTALALEGYTISMPNYTGSLGYGDKHIQTLVGRVGTLDVADCMASVHELVRRGIADPERQLVCGGSHGGFLTGHLIGQYPDAFRAAVMLNPVTSLGEFSASSDLPDFPFAEAGLAYAPGAGVTPAAYERLYAASPIAHVDKVRAPVLLVLGEADLRVPPTQGRGYYHALRARGARVEMVVFGGEGHGLEGVGAQRVTYEAIRDWFGVHTRGAEGNA